MSAALALCEIRFAGGEHAPVCLPKGSNLSEHLTVENSPVLFGCRTGICATCLVEVSGSLPPPSEDEREVLEIVAPDNPKARLACQIDLTGPISITYKGSL